MSRRNAKKDLELGKTLDSDLPEDRFDKKIVVKEDNESSKTPDFEKITGGEAVKTGDRINVTPKSGAKLDATNTIGGIPIEGGAINIASAAGGSPIVPTVDSTKIPYNGGGHRPDSRLGKIAAPDDFIIENTASEQIDPEFDESKTLSEQPDALQGYNGQKRFKNARGKKTYGQAPQDVLFDRSADVVEFDKTIHTTGQVLGNIDNTASYPTSKTEIRSNGLMVNEAIVNPMTKSNYLLKSFNFTITDGIITAVRFNEDQINAHVHNEDAMEANMNWQVDQNNVAKTVLNLQKDLGRETTENWSPLGYVINQPYEYNMLMHDIEATSGAIMSLANRSINTSLSYQLHNVLAKRGSAGQRTMIEMVYGGIGDIGSSDTTDAIMDAYDNNMQNALFSEEALSQGLATGIIKMFDSTAKYTTKGSLVNMPKGFKQFIQKMNNNIGVLNMHEKVAKAIDIAHTFSTPDGSYSPTQPIFQTRRISVMNPLSLNFFLKDWSRDNISSDNPAGTAELYSYGYNDLRNNYDMPVKHYLVDGIMTWLLKHESALVKAYGTNAEVSIPAFFDMLHPTMFSQILAAASQDILIRRTVSFKDVLFAGDQTEYIYKDLSSVSELNPLRSRNLKIHGWQQALELGKLHRVSKLHAFYGETYTVLGASDGALSTKKASILLPWYKNEKSFRNAYSSDYGFGAQTDTKFNMSFPSVRVGTNHEYIQSIFDDFNSEREVRLSLDKTVGIPLPMQRTDGEYTDSVYSMTSTSGDLTNGIKLSTVRYDNNSDGRVVVSYENGVTRRSLPTKASILAQPRELGLIFEAGRNAPIITGVTGEGRNIRVTTGGNLNVNNAVDGSNSFKLISYSADSSMSRNRISRGAALRQEFHTYFADRTMSAANTDFVQVQGFSPSITDLFEVGTNGAITLNSNTANIRGSYALNGSTYVEIVNAPTFVTFSRYFWTMLNRFFLPINPFSGSMIDFNADVPTRGLSIDPFETAFYFGLAGTLASDFLQDVDQRSVTYETMGLDYTSDVFTKDSPITYDE